MISILLLYIKWFFIKYVKTCSNFVDVHKNSSVTSLLKLINVVDICENRLTLDRHVLQKRVEIWTNICRNIQVCGSGRISRSWLIEENFPLLKVEIMHFYLSIFNPVKWFLGKERSRDKNKEDDNNYAFFSENEQLFNNYVKIKQNPEKSQSFAAATFPSSFLYLKELKKTFPYATCTLNEWDTGSP
jgi:hypothetical protein